jgi:hypothetical protein
MGLELPLETLSRPVGISSTLFELQNIPASYRINIDDVSSPRQSKIRANG